MDLGRAIFGVAYCATGAALSPVSFAPGAGQYTVTNGVYGFSAADAGGAVTIGYGYVPQDVAQAATELAAERFRSAERIGLRSKAVGGLETISYDIERDLRADPRDAAAVQASRGLMFALDLDGFDAAIARLDGLPAAIGAALAAKAAEAAAALADRVRTDKLSGGVLNARSGALRDSIVADVSVEADGVHATVGSNGDVKYAEIQEFGGKTAAHEILPVKAQALAFVAAARRVSLGESSIRARSFPSGPICVRRSTR